MKILSRDFTTKEKVLILLLALVLLGLCYYRFIYVTCRDAIAEANELRDDYQMELNGALAKEAQLRSMQEELDRIGELKYASRMESYNNVKAEIALLNNVLKPATDYSISFSKVSRNGDQIRRSFTLDFTTNGFDNAKQIISDLAGSEYRCLIGGIFYNGLARRAGDGDKLEGGRWIGDDYVYDTVSVKMTATFYETMYGGTPDEVLPAK